MLERVFRLRENSTSVRIEVITGLTTFMTMAYIIFIQPAMLSGQMSGSPTGMDAGAVMTATRLASALATLVLVGVMMLRGADRLERSDRSAPSIPDRDRYPADVLDRRRDRAWVHGLAAYKFFPAGSDRSTR